MASHPKDIFPSLIIKRDVLDTGLTYSIWAAISFKTLSLGTLKTAIQSFSPRFKNTVEVIFLNAV
jgi:hypothetical protein